MIKHDVSLYLALLVFTFFTPELDPLAWEMLIYLNFVQSVQTAGEQVYQENAQRLYVAKIFITASLFIMFFSLRGAIRLFYKKPLAHVSAKTNELALKYRGIEAVLLDEKDLKTILTEIRSIFCKFYSTNEISITLFKIDRTPSLVAKSYLHVDEDGFVDSSDVPSEFQSGKGFCGIALKTNKPKFGRKRTWLGLRKNPEYLDIGVRDDSNAYSFWCFPIHSGGYDKKHIVYMLAIETSRMKYFDLFARRDGSNRNISHKLDNLLGSVYHCIHNEKQQ